MSEDLWCRCGHAFDDHANFGECLVPDCPECGCKRFRPDYHAGLMPDAQRVIEQMERWHLHRDFYYTHDGRRLPTHNPAGENPQPCPGGR